jgi:lactate dehydrogenase-like 2-hydroxyacid dehydrogenase
MKFKKNMIYHFDVDEQIKPYLTKGELFPNPVSPETLSRIPKKEKVEIMTCKSQSHVTSEVIDAFPNLKMVIARTAGVDFIDTEACKAKGIIFHNIPDYGNYNIAEHALALVLAGARHIVNANTEIHTGLFSYKNFLGKAIRGKTVGVIGTGRIGLAFIQLIRVFDVKILAFDIFQNMNAQKEYGFAYVPLKKLLQDSDIISIHVPLLPDTHHLLNDEKIKLIKFGAILVNTSRGAIINTTALIKNISKFQAVCLDVLEDEQKFSKDNPLLTFSNVIITPHIAFYTDDSVKRIGDETIKYITNYSP